MPKRHYRKRSPEPNPLALIIAIVLVAIFVCPSLLSSTFTGKNSFIPLIIIFLIVGLIVIGIAAFIFVSRQKKQHVALQAATDYKLVQNLNDLRPRELEELAAKVYERLGYRNVKHTGGHASTDGGVDVWMLNSEGHVEIVQCKQLSSRVDRPEIVKFADTMRKQHAVVGHYWAPNEFTQPAIDFAGEHNIKLYERRDIIKLVDRAFPPKPLATNKSAN
jgi:hypothetical protein